MWKAIIGAAGLFLTLLTIFFVLVKPSINEAAGAESEKKIVSVREEIRLNQAEHRAIEERLGKRLDDISDAQRETNRKLDTLLLSMAEHRGK